MSRNQGGIAEKGKGGTGKIGGCTADKEGDLLQTQQRERECEISDELEGWKCFVVVVVVVF